MIDIGILQRFLLSSIDIVILRTAKIMCIECDQNHAYSFKYIRTCSTTGAAFSARANSQQSLSVNGVLNPRRINGVTQT